MKFSADLHLRHKFMATHRGFESLDEHDEFLIEQWRATVGRREDIYFLGDFTFARKEDAPKLFQALTGTKHLVVGNHDPKHVRDLPWASVHDLRKVKYMGRSIVLCHYPMLTWQNAHHGTWHLHGHSHGNGRWSDSTRMDVGIDCHPEMRPFDVEEVVAILSQRQYDYVDHHVDDKQENT